MSNLIATVTYDDSNYLIAYENKQLKVYNLGSWIYSSKVTVTFDRTYVEEC